MITHSVSSIIVLVNSLWSLGLETGQVYSLQKVASVPLSTCQQPGQQLSGYQGYECLGTDGGLAPPSSSLGKKLLFTV